MVDTGANCSLFFEDVEPWLKQQRDSTLSIQVADSNTMKGGKDGILHLLIMGAGSLTTAGKGNETPVISQQVTTVHNLSRELQSVDHAFVKEKMNILLKQPEFEDGLSQMYRPATQNSPEVRIPFRYDYINGGFWMDYILLHNPTDKDRYAGLLRDYTADATANSSKSNCLQVEHFSPTEAIALTIETWEKDEVTEIYFGQHSDERTIRGVKAGLRKNKRQLTAHDFHEEFCHTGSLPGCIICAQVKGAMRRIFKKVDPYKEIRPAHSWHLDTITWSHRSHNGSKYHAVLKCAATDYYDNILSVFQIRCVLSIRTMGNRGESRS